MQMLTTTGSLSKLVEGDDLDVINLVLPKGQDLGRHSSPRKVVVVPYKGHIEFTSDTESFDLKPGSIMVMEPGEFHALKPLEDSELMVIKWAVAE